MVLHILHLSEGSIPYSIYSHAKITPSSLFFKKFLGSKISCFPLQPSHNKQRRLFFCYKILEDVMWLLHYIYPLLVFVAGRKKKKKVLKASEVYSSTSSDGEGEERRKSSSSRWGSKNDVSAFRKFLPFRPPGSGSVSWRYGSGSFHRQVKIVRKTFLFVLFFDFFMTFCLWKMM